MGRYYDQEISLKENYNTLMKIIKKDKDIKFYIHNNIFNFARKIKINNYEDIKNYGFTKEEIDCMSLHNLSNKYIEHNIFTEFNE